MKLRFSIFGNSYYFTFKFFWLTSLLVLLFSNLGMWQYHRAEQKRLLIQSYTERRQHPIDASALFKSSTDPRFYAVKMRGHFDNQHLLFLDNKTQHGQVGYEVYSPFLPQGSQQAILVDRGWVAADRNRQVLPEIKPVSGLIALEGVVNTPPSYFSLGAMTEGQQAHFPLRVQYIKPQELASITGLDLSTSVLWLDPADSHGFDREFKVTLMGPEKHIMYTVQWFAFALSLLVLFGVLNLHKVRPRVED